MYDPRCCCWFPCMIYRNVRKDFLPTSWSPVCFPASVTLEGQRRKNIESTKMSVERPAHIERKWNLLFLFSWQDDDSVCDVGALSKNAQNTQAVRVAQGVRSERRDESVDKVAVRRQIGVNDEDRKIGEGDKSKEKECRKVCDMPYHESRDNSQSILMWRPLSTNGFLVSLHACAYSWHPSSCDCIKHFLQETIFPGVNPERQHSHLKLPSAATNPFISYYCPAETTSTEGGGHVCTQAAC